MKKIILFFILLLLVGCTTEDATIKTLKKAGYSNIEITSWKPLSCGEGDWYSTGFTAENVNGEKIDGVVCCGLIFKSCTIRY